MIDGARRELGRGARPGRRRASRETIAAHGPDSVAFYVSGQCLTEDYYVANKLMKGFIGSGNIDTNSRLCMASSVAGHVRAFGADVVPGIYEDLELADLVVLVGSNLAWCHPVLFQRLQAARAARGTRMVVIDPRRTATCRGADLHLPLAPGSDVRAVRTGCWRIWPRRGAIDRAWVARAHGRARGGAGSAGATAVADVAGDLPASTRPTSRPSTTWFAAHRAHRHRVLAGREPVLGRAPTRSTRSSTCHLATGRIGRPGAGPF